MSTDINTVNSGSVFAVPRRASSAPRTESTDVPETPVGSGVQLTAHSLSLHQAGTDAHEAPMDMQRIARLRDAINNGQYSIDALRIARKFLDHASELP